MPSAGSKIGVLALQGGFELHVKKLIELGADPLPVRTLADLACCSALILPGGESTTIFPLLAEQKMDEALVNFGQSRPLFGTCAGLIVLARLGILNVEIERNAYGRQCASFVTEHPFPAVFIRAPKILSHGKEVEVLATHAGCPVLIKQGRHLGATFHPELTSDCTVHSLFLTEANK